MTLHDRSLVAQPTPEAARRLMATRGVVRFPSVIPAERLSRLRADAEAAYAVRRAIQTENGVAAGQEGAAHHVLGAGDSLDAFIADLPLWERIEDHFGGKFILTSFGAALHPPGAGAKVVDKTGDAVEKAGDHAQAHADKVEARNPPAQ